MYYIHIEFLPEIIWSLDVLAHVENIFRRLSRDNNLKRYIFRDNNIHPSFYSRVHVRGIEYFVVCYLSVDELYITKLIIKSSPNSNKKTPLRNNKCSKSQAYGWSFLVIHYCDYYYYCWCWNVWVSSARCCHRQDPPSPSP